MERTIEIRENMKVFNTDQLMVSGRQIVCTHVFSVSVTSIELVNITFCFLSLKYLRVVDEFTLFIWFALHIEINTTALISNTLCFYFCSQSLSQSYSMTHVVLHMSGVMWMEKKGI